MGSLVGSSVLIGAGALVGGSPLSASAITPANLSDVALWLEAASTTLSKARADSAQEVPVDTDTIGGWIRPGDVFGTPSFTYATQASPAAEPVLEIAASRYWVHSGTDLFMSLSAAVALTGDFVLWAVCKRTTATELVLVGHSATGLGAISSDSDNVVRVFDDSGTEGVKATDPAGTSLLRYRRSGTHLYFAATGIAESEMLASGLPFGTATVTVDQVLAGYNDALGVQQYSDALNALGALIISTNAGHAANPPAGIDTGATSYFKASTANVAAAWDVSL